MADRKPATEESMLGADAPASAWTTARERLESPEKGRIHWLATVRPDGRPHVMPLLGLWLDGAFYFVTSEKSRKGRNLGDNPRCVITTSSTTLPSLDLIIEGTGRKVTDDATMERVTEAYRSKMQWPLDVRDGGLFGPNAPTAGPPPYAVFGVTPTTVFGLPGTAGMEDGKEAKDPISPTRWRFDG